MNPEITIRLEQIQKLQDEIKEIRKTCEHNYKENECQINGQVIFTNHNNKTWTCIKCGNYKWIEQKYVTSTRIEIIIHE